MLNTLLHRKSLQFPSDLQSVLAGLLWFFSQELFRLTLTSVIITVFSCSCFHRNTSDAFTAEATDRYLSEEPMETRTQQLLANMFKLW